MVAGFGQNPHPVAVPHSTSLFPIQKHPGLTFPDQQSGMEAHAW